MYYPFFMQVSKCVYYLYSKEFDLVLGETSMFFEQLVELTTSDVRHDEEETMLGNK